MKLPAIDAARIMIVDDDPVLVHLVRGLGRHQLFEVVGASTIAQALKRASDARPDAVLIDLHLGADESGLDLPARLRALPGMASVPIGFLSGDGSAASRIAASKAGAAVYMTKPIDAEQLASVVHRLVALGTAPAPQILIAATGSAPATAVGEQLTAAGMSVYQCGNGDELPARLSEVRPDLLLLDADFAPYGAIDTCRMIRGLPRWHDLHIMLMAEPADDAERHALRLVGADEWLRRPVGARELLDKISAGVNRVRRLRERFDRDPVTGLSLRRGFLEQAGARAEEALARGTPYSISLLDLDHFKRINDQHGHHVGDAVLARLGRLLQTRLRPQDLRARWGGEEFCLAFSGEPAHGAHGYVARVLGDFREQAFSDDHGQVFQASFSAGVASLPEDGTSLEQLLRSADERLYQAKAQGRSRIVG